MKPEDRKLDLPESLARQLEAFERKLRRVETVVTVCGALFGLLATYGLLFLSDRVWDTPAWLRALLTLAGMGGFAWFAWFWLNHWWWRRRNARDLARMVQRSYRQLGDRLLGVVELADAEKVPEDVSPALCRAAIRQVADETRRLDFQAAVSRRVSRRIGWAMVAVAALVAAPFILFPQAGWNALVRWINPLSSVERFTFVNIEDLPEALIVPHGEPFEIACRLTEASSWKPESATARFRDQPPIVSALVQGQAVFAIPGQTRDGSLHLRIGDVVKRIWVTPAHRPELLRMTAGVALPDYLQRPPEEVEINNGLTDLLEGSRVSFRGRVSRELAQARVEELHSQPVKIDQDVFASPTVVAGQHETMTFSWTDQLGLTAAEPYVLSLNTVKDEEPLVECKGLTRTAAILEDEVIELDVAAQDDFGLQKLWVDWSSEGNAEKGVPSAAGEEAIGEGSPATPVIDGQFTFSPLTAHVSEDSMIKLRAYALDYLPGRAPAASLEYKIYVLNRAQHAKMIQQRMEALMARIEDLARNEENLMQDNQGLNQMTDAELGEQKSGEKLKKSELQESRNAGELDRLADEGKDIMKEGLRNKDIPERTLRNWNELTDAMQSLAQNQMKQSSQALQQAGAKKQKRRENLEEAIELEEEIVKQLRDMEQSANESIEQMLAQNFINRLRQVGSMEKGIGNQLTEMMARIIGLTPKELPPKEAEDLGRLATRQTTARKDAGYIQDDLAGFYNRTRDDAYNTVFQEMVELKTTQELEAIAGLISENVGGQSIGQTRTWSVQFNKWADYLEENGSDGEGESGECSQAQVDLETLLALIRARQREETLREQTRRLEEIRETNRLYVTDARKLAASQFDLGNEMGQLERRVDDDKVKQLIAKVSGEMMNAGILLRKPRTDQDTIAVETEIIELLSFAMKNCSGSTGKAGQALMAMMGMQPGSSSGGNPGGGDTDRANQAFAGSVGGEAEDRKVGQTGGVDPAEFPAEFRNELESYFNALEATEP